jgi:uncharacterized membrane protein
MSSLEKRAWLTLWSMCPPYLVYFAIQAGFADVLSTMGARIACLAAVASAHALIYLIGHLAMLRQERLEPMTEDERDRAIDGRATRMAYFTLLTGIILVGVVMPFSRSGWDLVNAALLAIVIAEAVRHVLILQGYRAPRHAH